eukprot:1409669-Pleurochrysis_carterae.AAC.2
MHGTVSVPQSSGGACNDSEFRLVIRSWNATPNHSFRAHANIALWWVAAFSSAVHGKLAPSSYVESRESCNFLQLGAFLLAWMSASCGRWRVELLVLPDLVPFKVWFLLNCTACAQGVLATVARPEYMNASIYSARMQESGKLSSPL